MSSEYGHPPPGFLAGVAYSFCPVVLESNNYLGGFPDTTCTWVAGDKKAKLLVWADQIHWVYMIVFWLKCQKASF